MSNQNLEEPIKLEDTIENMIDFCFQVLEVSETPISGDNPTKKRINKFKILFDQKKNKPNNLKGQVVPVYEKCKGEILNLEIGDDLSEDMKRVKSFLTWFSNQSLSIQPRESERSVSIPLSIICRECLRISESNEEKEDIYLLFTLLLFRILAFASSDEEEEKIDKKIAYLESVLEIEADECPDVSNFFFHLMDKVTGKYGGKEASQQIKNMMKGKMKKEDRKKYEEMVMNLADSVLSKIPKDAENMTPADLQATFMDLNNFVGKSEGLPEGIAEALKAVSQDKN